MRDKSGTGACNRNGHPKTVYVREDRMLPAIEQWFIENIFNTDKLVRLQDRFNSATGPDTERREREAASLERELTKLDLAETRYKEAIASGIDPGRVREWIREDAKKRADLQNRIAELRKPTNDYQGLEDILAKIPDLSEQLLSASPELKRELFQAFSLQCVWDHGNKRLKVSVRPAAFFLNNPGHPSDPGDSMCPKWCQRGETRKPFTLR
jgi:hypothetical protein